LPLVEGIGADPGLGKIPGDSADRCGGSLTNLSAASGAVAAILGRCQQD
jgi:hypothetical protein